MKIEGIEISNPEKEIFPGITKIKLAYYYQKIAPYILPCIKNRPLTMVRFPDGINKPGFFNKHAANYFPKFVHRTIAPMVSKAGNIEMAMANNIESLIYLVEQDVVEFHIALSKKDSYEKPDHIIFDLDPSDNNFEKVREVALNFKNLLADLKLISFVKLTGISGIHIYLPLKVEQQFTKIKPYAKQLAFILNKRLPKITTLEHRKEKREDKVYIDILRNDYARSAIAPYSLRAKPKATIATPIEWDELNNKSIQANSYTIKNIFRRLARKKIPWDQYISYQYACTYSQLEKN